MTYEEINAVYADLQSYYIGKIEECCDGQDQVEVNLVDQRDIMIAEGGYLPEQDSEYFLKKTEIGYALIFVNGCDTDEYLLDYFFSTREKAEKNLVKDSSGPGYRKTYKVEEIELDKFITKPEYRKYKQFIKHN